MKSHDNNVKHYEVKRQYNKFRNSQDRPFHLWKSACQGQIKWAPDDSNISIPRSLLRYSHTMYP